ncbi:MAG: Na/Pi cotransporter family protein [Oscillospiraceae bacterium]|nr:Na/Pi cotransporter family protein [Oscillospiraceae bacterium]
MDIFSVFTLLGGLAFFLFGMTIMSSGLEKIAGGKLETTLKKMTSNPFKSLVLGAGITIAIQSSSAMTVMLVGLVNSGIMDLGQTIGVLMGSNIGTTLTAWILGMTGIQSDSFFLKLLKPENFSPVVAFIGILMIMIAKSSKKKDVGNILVGFAVLMYGMKLMSNAVSPLADMPGFKDMLTAFNNPILGVLVGALFTAAIQSSAASVGILQALSLTGSITYGMALPIIMGQNIGTCITAVISSIGVNKNAKRVAAVHIYFNVIGTVICLCLFYAANAVFRFAFIDDTITPFRIAMLHSIFNIVTTALLLPFSKWLEKLARLTIKDVSEKEKYTLLDDRLLQTPSFAIAECRNLTVKMAVLSRDTLDISLDTLLQYDEKSVNTIVENESIVDEYEDKLGTYLVKISGRELTTQDANSVSRLLHCIGDFERISDHAVNLMQVAKEMYDKQITFSEEAKSEVRVIIAAVTEILNMSITAFENNDEVLARKVEPLEEVIDGLRMELKNRHIHRLQEDRCTIELGFIFSDLLTNLERVSDHCSNIAVCLIQLKKEKFDTHEYITDLKENDADFQEMCTQYLAKYTLPKEY